MFLRYNSLGIIWTLVILFLCGIPGNRLPNLSFWEYLTFDKVAHVGVFGLHTLLLVVGFRRQHQFRGLNSRAKSWAFAVSAIYGIIIELLQLAIFEGRSAELFDVGANLVGCLFGILAFRFIYGRELATW